MSIISDFGTWASPISADLLTTAQVSLGAPVLDGRSVYWLEGRPQDAGHQVLVRSDGPGRHLELTAAPFNVRSRVHEYGGGAFAVRNGLVLAVNFKDQRVHLLVPGEAPTPITPLSGGALRYADFSIAPNRDIAFAVREDHRHGGEPRNTIVALDLSGNDDAGRVLAKDRDFFSAPRICPEGRRLAWLAWDHPNMPWDGTTLWLAEMASNGALKDVRQIAGGPAESVMQPAWSPDGSLHFVSDRSGWWNLYRWEGDAARPVCPMSAEFAGPGWSFGQSWYGFAGPDTIIAAFVKDGVSGFGRIAVSGGRFDPIPLPYSEVSSVFVKHGRAALRVGAVDRPASIIVLDPETGVFKTMKVAGDLPADPAFIARPQAITFETEGGAAAHAFYYPPTHPEAAAPADRRPPLIVKGHGGPTGSASSELSLSTQFWTSRGFAVCDVDYGGSTGYGRAYRERLNGRWGVVDVQDCVHAARHLVRTGRADPLRLAITGGSAGGFTTLAALTFHDVFKAGASHYGVSDLEALTRDTHKFESRYLDRLVGPYPEAIELYKARSPIHHVDRLACPIIFFQGLEDLIVPPNQAAMMVEALKAKRLPVAYLSFEGEQHGFRRADTIRAVRLAELAFYGRVFGFRPAGGLADLRIDNLD